MESIKTHSEGVYFALCETVSHKRCQKCLVASSILKSPALENTRSRLYRLTQEWWPTSVPRHASCVHPPNISRSRPWVDGGCYLSLHFPFSSPKHAGKWCNAVLRRHRVGSENIAPLRDGTFDPWRRPQDVLVHNVQMTVWQSCSWMIQTDCTEATVCIQRGFI